MLDFIGRYNCNPKLNFDFLDIPFFAIQYENFLSQLEQLVIHYSFSQTMYPRKQCFEEIESIFERPYTGLCDIA